MAQNLLSILKTEKISKFSLAVSHNSKIGDWISFPEIEAHAPEICRWRLCAQWAYSRLGKVLINNSGPSQDPDSEPTQDSGPDMGRSGAHVYKSFLTL